MKQFAVQRTEGGRMLIVADRDDYDPMWGFWRLIALLPERSSIRYLT